MGSLLDKFSRRSREESRPVDPDEADIEQLVGEDGLASIVQSIAEPPDQDSLLRNFDGSLQKPDRFVGQTELDGPVTEDEDPPREEELSPFAEMPEDEQSPGTDNPVSSTFDEEQEKDLSPPLIPGNRPDDWGDPPQQNASAQDDVAEELSHAQRMRQWLLDQGAHPVQAQEIFTAVGPTWLRESVRVARATVGFFGNDENAVFAAGAFLGGLWGLLEDPETTHFDCRAASGALRALGVEPPRDNHNKFPRSREVYAKVAAGAYTAIQCGFVGSDESAIEAYREVGYIVGPEDEA